MANFDASCLATFFKSTPKASRPLMEVMCFRLLRSMRLMMIWSPLKSVCYEGMSNVTHLRRHLLLLLCICLGCSLRLLLRRILL